MNRILKLKEMYYIMNIYSAQQLNEMIGYVDKSGSNSSKKDIITRCKNAGLIVEALETKRGLPN